MSGVMAYDVPAELYTTIWPCKLCTTWHVELVPDFHSVKQFDTFMQTPPTHQVALAGSIVLRIWHAEDCPSWEQR